MNLRVQSDTARRPEQYLRYTSTWCKQLQKEVARSDDSRSEGLSLPVRERKGVVCANGESQLP